MYRVLLVAAAVAVAGTPHPSSAQTQKNTMAHAERAVHAVAEFRRTRALPRLQQAVTELEGATAAHRPGPERDEVTRAWLTVFRAVDSAKDPSFDPNDLPEVNLIPPTVNGVTYPSGTDPRSIPDPAARAKYEEMLRANEAKSQRFTLQYGLRALDRRASNAFATYMHDTYTAAAADTSDLKRLVRGSGLTAARSTAVLQTMTKRG